MVIAEKRYGGKIYLDDLIGATGAAIDLSGIVVDDCVREMMKGG